ncbi:MAG TPA: hypothetical protein VL966_08765 [Alphaproteobacteria bacterium]|jgi:hypothetical protein|nr:hypothetical protein [Alphaproteobacteria bacterium]
MANSNHLVNMSTGQLVVGTPQDDNLTIHPGDTAYALAGDDTVTIVPLLGT